MSLIRELKRRNVFRVAIAYLVVSWLVMQVADVVINNIGAPDWLFQTILLVLGIGFPIALLFAWAFEMTPEGIKKEKDVDRTKSIAPTTGRKLDRMIIGILAVSVAYLLVDKLVLQNGSPVAADRAAITIAESPVDNGPSVAVLPFVNMSGDKENEYFSDGLTETLLHMLAQIPDLRVAARTSSFAFKDQNISVDEIAATLGVAHILEGSVQKSGERVRITAQLIRASDGFHAWSQNYTRPLEDIFAIQDEIATDVATALDASLLGNTIPDLKGLNTKNLTSYDNYLKGLEQQAIFSYGSLNDAEDHFKQALALDPDFTDARLALIRNYLLKNGTGVINEEELRALAEPLIAQVREKDPANRLARAFELHMDLSNFSTEIDSDETQAMVTELRNMLPLIADETLIRQTVANRLNFFFKQQNDAIEVIEAGLMRDPLSAELHGTLGDIYRYNERFEKALESLKRAQELAPENPNNYGALAELEKQLNNLAASLNWERQAIELDPQDHELAADISQLLYRLELPEEGDRWFNRVKALAPGSDIARSVELDRAVAMNDTAMAIRLAEAMIADQVDQRRGSFSNAINTYSDLMLKAGKGKQAWEFFVSVRPEIANYDVFPSDINAALMQFNSIGLMSGFEAFETRKEAWVKLAANLDAKGFPWRDPKDSNFIIDLVMLGQTDAATNQYLDNYLSRPMATNVERHKRNNATFWQSVYDDPRVSVRLAELGIEYEQLRQEISELMQQPEWNP